MPIYRITQERRVNTHSIDDQAGQQVTALAGGGWVVTWQSAWQDGDGRGVYQQAYAADGTQIGSEIQVNAHTASDQEMQEVTPLANGGWVVTWHSRDQDGSGYGVYQQAFAADGTKIGAEILVNTTTDGTQEFPKITALGDSTWVVTWQSLNQDGTEYSIYQQAYRLNGTQIEAVGGESQLDTFGGSYANLQVKSLGDLRWVVTWQSEAQDGSGNGVYQRACRLTDSEIRTIPGEPRVNTQTQGHQDTQQVTVLDDGRWVVTWTSKEKDRAEYDVYQRVYRLNNGALEAVSGETLVNTFTDNDQVGSQVSALSGGGWVVTWSSHRQDGDGYGVYQQAYAANGTKIGGETRVNTFTDGEQNDQQVTAVSGGGWVVTWTSLGQDGGDAGVYQQIFAADGTKVGRETLVNGHTDNYQGGARITGLSGGWVVTWVSRDQDQGGDGVYQRSYQTVEALGAGVQHAAGTVGDDVFNVTPGGLTAGDTIEGNDGYDTLRLTAAGTLDLAAPTAFTGIERLLGSAGADSFVVSGERLGGVRAIDGGGGDDEIRLADLADFSNVTVTDVDRIQLLSGAILRTDDKATALLAVATTEDASVTLVGGTFSSADLAKLFGQGVRLVIDDLGVRTYGALDVAGPMPNRTTDMTAPVGPFAEVEVNAADGLSVTATVKFQAGRGELKNITNGEYKIETGTYTVSGAVADVQAALRALRFDPRDRADVIGSTETTRLELAVTDNVAAEPIKRYVEVTSRATNLSPGDPVLSRSTVQENAKAGTLVGEVVAVDPNPQDGLTITLTGNAGGRFELQGTRLVVKQGAVLDFETARFHEVAIRVSDAGGLNVEKTLRVDVANILVETIRGTAAKDVLKGGLGQDAFLFDVRPAKRNVDKVESFVVKDDAVWLENGVYKSLGKKGSLDNPLVIKKDVFFTGTKAGDAEDRVIYDRKSGKLFYDEDGTGAKAQVLIAQMQKNLRLTEKDFFVV